MTDSQQKSEEINVLSGDKANEDAVGTQSRRSALGLSFAGGLAAMLAACGKYVTKFDKTAVVPLVDAKGSGNSDPNSPGTKGLNQGGVTATPGPTTESTPEPPNPPSKFCFDTSKATVVAGADFFVAGATALYGTKFSSLLAAKVKKGAASSPAVGDLVHVLLKKSATESFLAASRRVRSTDNYADGIGLVFESLYVDSYMSIQLLVTKGDKQYLSEIPIAYASVHNGKPVYDMSLVRTDLNKSKDLFALGFGDSGAPTMENTSNITGNKSISGLLYGGSYEAAIATSTWDLSKLIPSETDLKNIFGQPMASASNLLHEHQSLVVYRPKSATVNGKAFDGYIRYFIYVG